MIHCTIHGIRLTAVAAVLVGSSVASSVASATTESPAADPVTLESVPESDAPAPSDDQTVTEPVAEVPDDSIGVEVPDDSIGVEVPDDSIGVEVPDDSIGVEVPDDSIGVEGSDDPVSDAPDEGAGKSPGEPRDPEPAATAPSAPEPGGADDQSGASADEGGDSGCGGGGGHEPGEDDDHEGCGDQGNPYRMTFAVRWYTPAGDQVLQPAPEWRDGFRLEAASRTGSGKVTTATCTYPGGRDELTCQFRNPGHDDIVDGMVVPAKRTATYTVSVTAGGSNQWNIVNANGDGYSARALCPRGGGGDHGTDSGGGEVWYCQHTVEMHELDLAAPPEPEPPETDPPPTVPPETEPPPTVPPEDAEPPTVDPPTTVSPASPAPVAPDTLPATGNSTLTPLVIGALLVAIGAALVAQTRRGRMDDLS
jgi:LPXTG-motif cell wall-anchored protein